MAWLPSTIRESRVSHPCLFCNQESLEGHNGTLEVIQIFCHILHVNWTQLLASQPNQDYPLCLSCNKRIIDVTTIWEELQLMETLLRSKIKEMQVDIIESSTSQPNSNLNLIQKHFFEESRNSNLMQKQLALVPNAKPVQPSFIQLHIDLLRIPKPVAIDKDTDTVTTSNQPTESVTKTETPLVIITCVDTEGTVNEDTSAVTPVPRPQGTAISRRVANKRGASLVELDWELYYDEVEDYDDGIRTQESVSVPKIKKETMKTAVEDEKSSGAKIYSRSAEIVRCSPQVEPSLLDRVTSSKKVKARRTEDRRLKFSQPKALSRSTYSRLGKKWNTTINNHLREQQLNPETSNYQSTMAKDEMVRLASGEGYSGNLNEKVNTENSIHSKKRRIQPIPVVNTRAEGNVQTITSTVVPSRYTCDQCGSRFVHRTSLAHHRRSDHSGDKMLKCELCGKEFKPGRTNDLRKHLGFCKTRLEVMNAY